MKRDGEGCRMLRVEEEELQVCRVQIGEKVRSTLAAFGPRPIRLPAKSSLRRASRPQRHHCRRARCARERRHLCVLGWLQGECRGAVQRFRARRLQANSVEAETLEQRDTNALGKRARG
jgi:hypothetical protein